MSEDKFQEPDFEKLIDDFLLETDQLEEGDLDFYKQTIEPYKKSFNDSGKVNGHQVGRTIKSFNTAHQLF